MPAEQVIVGVNKFQSEEDLSHLKTLKVSPEGEEKQNERLRQIKKEKKFSRCFDGIGQGQRSG